MNQFVWDDGIVLNQQLPGFKTLSDIFFPNFKISQISTEYYRPFIFLTYVIDLKIWGKNPLGWHLTGLMFHLANTLLVFLLTRFFFKKHPKSIWISLVSSSVFAIHPIHTENIAWMAGRNDTIAAFFMFFSFLCYLKYREKDQPPFYLLVLSSLSFLFALLSKEVAISLLFLFPLYDYWIKPKILSQENVDSKIPFFPYFLFFSVFLIYFFFRKTALGNPFGNISWVDGSNGNISFFLISIIGFYIKKLLWPFHLQAFIPEIPSSFNDILMSSFLLVCSFMLFIWACNKKHFEILFLISWVFITLTPTLTVAFSYLSKTPVADRYLYIPSFGFSGIFGTFVVFLFSTFFHKRNIKKSLQLGLGILLCALILGPLAMTSFKKNQIWKNNLTLWSDIVKKAPDYGLPHNNLGDAYFSEGRFEDAEREFKLALQSKYEKFGKSLASTSLGKIYRLNGSYTKAEKYLRHALRLNPSNHLALFYLGNLNFDHAQNVDKDNPQRKEFLKKAAFYLNQALTINPFFPAGHYDLGLVYRQLGNLKKAQSHFEKVITLSANPSSLRVQNAKKLLKLSQKAR